MSASRIVSAVITAAGVWIVAREIGPVGMLGVMLMIYGVLVFIFGVKKVFKRDDRVTK
jgi:uncharacterized Tic20 family protein